MEYRAFNGWQEVIEEVTKVKPPLSAPLNGSRAAISPDGVLVVRVGNPFFLTLLSREEARATVRAIAAAVGDAPISSIEFQASAPKEASNSILDALENALRECK